MGERFDQLINQSSLDYRTGDEDWDFPDILEEEVRIRWEKDWAYRLDRARDIEEHFDISGYTFSRLMRLAAEAAYAMYWDEAQVEGGE
jgi:hypothetical protein